MPTDCTHLDEEEAGGGGGVVVDVDGDQDTGDHDDHHHEDTQDQPRVEGVSARGPLSCAVSRHGCNTAQHAG